MAKNNATNDATQLRISIIEKQLLQQSQTSKEILNQLKSHKRSEKSKTNYPAFSDNQQIFPPENVVYSTAHTKEQKTKIAMGHKYITNASIQSTYSPYSNVLSFYHPKPFLKNNLPNTLYIEHT
jgi:hypothetical protein